MQRQRENFPILLRLNYHKMITKLVLKNVIDETELFWRDLWKCYIFAFVCFFSAVDSDYATMKISFAVKYFPPKKKILPKDFRKILLTFKASAKDANV